jgi:hypothetical protein
VGRLLKRAEEVRLIADYRGDSVELADARELVEQAETFVSTMHGQLASKRSSDDDREIS